MVERGIRVGVRVIVGLTPDADWRAVDRSLREQGAEDVRPPRAELPDVVVATFPEGTDVEELSSRALRLPGVAYAERDVFRSTMGENASPPET
jgi:hypothetical protein